MHKGCKQMSGTRIVPPRGGWWRAMQYVIGNSRKTRQAARLIQVGHDGQRTQGSQCGTLFHPADHRAHAKAPRQPRDDAAGHVSAADNQHFLHISTFH